MTKLKELVVGQVDARARLHDDRARLTENADPTGAVVNLGYDEGDRRSSVTDRLGDTISMAYHAESGQLASLTNARGDTLSYDYAPQEQTFTNPTNDEQVTFTFYNLAQVDYPDGTSESFAYDERGNVTARTDQAGAAWSYTYDERGQVLSTTNSNGGVTTFTYNADATLATRSDSDSGMTAYAYDEYKRLAQVTNLNGATIQIEYDLNDRVTAFTDENGETFTFAYDANGNLVQAADPTGAATAYEYDLLDRPIAITDRLGNTANLDYDALGRVAEVADPTGVLAQFVYDANGWPTQTSVGEHTWQMAYNAEGAPVAATTPLGNTVSYETDSLGSLTAMTDPLGNRTALTRDALNRLTEVADPLGRTTTIEYDDRGLLASIGVPGIGAAAYAWDDLGLLAAISDLNGSQWTFDYTPMGRLKTSTDPLGNIWQYAYDERGRLVGVTYPDGSNLTRFYDTAGNLIQSALDDLTLNYSYDALGRLVEADDLKLAYDAEGRITSTRTANYNSGATYDAAGRLTSVSYGDGLTVTYTYDPLTGLLTGVSDSLSGAQLTFVYDGDFNLVGVERSNGVNSTLTWDAAGNLTGLQDLSGLDVIIDLQYTLDAAGQVTEVVIDAPLDPGTALAGRGDMEIAATYDAASQLSSPGYEHDARGRLTASPDHTFQWDDASHLTGIDDVTLTYNSQGNIETRTENGQTTRYATNYALGLTPIVAEQDAVTGDDLRYYVWTPEGQLLYMIDASEENNVYFYHFDDAGSAIALTDTSGNPTDTYAYTPYGGLLDHQGTNSQPFTFLGQWGVRKEGDSSAFYHIRARYYDAATGRFISRDPVLPTLAGTELVSPFPLASYSNRGKVQAISVDPHDLNLYAYARENPISFVDIDGRSPEEGRGNVSFEERYRGFSERRNRRTFERTRNVMDRLRDLERRNRGNSQQAREMRERIRRMRQSFPEQPEPDDGGVEGTGLPVGPRAIKDIFIDGLVQFVFPPPPRRDFEQEMQRFNDEANWWVDQAESFLNEHAGACP